MNKLLFSLLIILLTIPSILGITSQDTCLDNETLRSNFTFNDTGSMKYIYSYEDCNWGCDNVTNTCYPSPTNSNLYMIGIVIVIAVLIFVVPKYFGR